MHKSFQNRSDHKQRGVRRSPSDLHYHDKKLIVDEFPIGICPNDLKNSVLSEATQHEVRQLARAFIGQRVILGIDRLDYIKGIPQKMRAFDKLLTDHPEWKGKAVLIQIAIPTRSDVEEYKMLRRQVEEIVGMINGKHGMHPAPLVLSSVNFTNESI